VFSQRQGKNAVLEEQAPTLKMEAAGLSKTLVSLCRTALYHIPQQNNRAVKVLMSASVHCTDFTSSNAADLGAL